jgi:hypothetical protein
MLTPADFIRLPYTPDLTQAGIAYACQSLHYTYDRMGGDRFARLRRIVAGKAVELAFKRLLEARQVPYDLLGTTPFTDPDRYDIAIGGRCCDIKSFMLSHKRQIRQVRRNPAMLLEADALVPTDQVASDHLNDEDLYIFAFLLALITPNQRTLSQAQVARQPIHLIYPTPKAWARPERWKSLGTLALKSNTSAAITLELGGQSSHHGFQTEQITLKPRQRATCQVDFYSLSYLQIPEMPDGVIGVHSPGLQATLLVEPLEWGNIWIYGMEIVLAGYLPRGEFRHTARLLPANSAAFQYRHTRTENLALPVQQLQPLETFFERARQWTKK